MRSLCETCASMREVITPKGSRFLLCQRLKGVLRGRQPCRQRVTRMVGETQVKNNAHRPGVHLSSSGRSMTTPDVSLALTRTSLARFHGSAGASEALR